MRRLVLLVALIALVAVAVRYLLEADEGTLDKASQRTADFVRDKGPGASRRAAAGIEKAGTAAEAGAKTARKLAKRAPVEGGAAVASNGRAESAE